jgi:IclR family acetate operon transcriptional repressor
MSTALERGLDVLELLADREQARVTEIMKMLGVSRATAFRIMVTLEARGYAVHSPTEHVWRLGPRVSALASSLESGSLVQAAATAMSGLHRETGETVNLAVLRRRRIIWAAAIEGIHPLRLSTTIGEVVPPHATAVGKAVLSGFPQPEWSRFLPPEPFPKITPNTRTMVSQLVPEIQACIERGWALDEEESELSGVCVAAPILGSDGRPVAAISVSSVAGRMPAEARARVGASVVRMCNHISAEIRGTRVFA